MTFSTSDAFVFGVTATSVVFIGLYWLWRTLSLGWKLGNAMLVALREVPRLTAALERLLTVVMRFSEDVRSLRQIATGEEPTPLQESTPSRPPIPRVPPAPGAAPFPKRDLSSFERQEPIYVPDAEIGDTVIHAPSDEEMTEYERLEKLRDAGIEPEEPEE